MIVRTEELRPSIWRSWPLLLLLGLLLATLLPSCNLGFTSDDYGNLVEATARLPLTESVDGLHRPIRNILFKLSYLSFGLHPAPYHLAIVLLHLAAVVLLYRFMQRLGGNQWAAFIAAAAYGFFPRNHQTLFWLAAGQDSVVTICALVACTAFVDYRNHLRLKSLCVALAAFIFALGFKETAVAILPLLLLVDMSQGGRISFRSLREDWKSYLPFILIVGVYGLWVRGVFSPNGVPQQFYGIQGPAQSLKLGIKFALNMVLPFSGPLEVRQLLDNPFLLGIASVVTLILGIAALVLVGPRKLLLSAGWIAVSAAPTAVLGFYADRYLGLPFVGVAMLLGFIGEKWISCTRRRTVAQFAVILLIGAYILGSVLRLAYYERQWKEAAQEVRGIMDRLHQLHPQVPAGSIFCFANLPHSRAHGQVYIMNTGLAGMFLAWGYDSSVVARHMPRWEDSREKQLVQRLSEVTTTDHPSPGKYILLFEEGQLHDLSGREAEQIVATSLGKEPELWR